MAILKYTADANMKSSYELLPKGRYLAMITYSEIKPNSKRTGDLLKLTFEIIDGPGKGRKVFESINVRHENKTAEKIGTEQLNMLCMATGQLHLQDSDQLHNIPVAIDVVIEAGRDGYDDQNRIKGYHAADEAGQAPAPVAKAASPATGGGTPVWKKKAA
jgi:hypothetical protein